MKRTLYRSLSLSRAKRMGSAASCDQVLRWGCYDKSLLCWKDLNVSTKLNTPEQVRYTARHYEICWGEKKSGIYRPTTQLGLINYQFLHRALFQPFSFYWKWVVQEQKLWLIMSFFSLRVQAGYKTLGLIKRKICGHTPLFRGVVLRETAAEDLCWGIQWPDGVNVRRWGWKGPSSQDLGCFLIFKGGKKRIDLQLN